MSLVQQQLLLPHRHDTSHLAVAMHPTSPFHLEAKLTHRSVQSQSQAWRTEGRLKSFRILDFSIETSVRASL